jgi:hypothetical protein
MKKTKLIEGPLGLPMTDQMAKSLEAVLKTLPKEQRTLKRKAGIAENLELIPGERAEISLVSAESIDREGEVVLAKGMELRWFQKNPVVTFAHKYDELPAGRCQWIKKVDGGLKAKTVYPKAPEDWQGPWLPSAIWQLTKDKALNGKSIGFIATKMRPPSRDEAHWKNAANVIESAILLEYAIAPIPVNQDAIVEAIAKGSVDQETLQRLGLEAVSQIIKSKYKKCVNSAALLLSAIEEVRLDPDKIAAQVIHNLATRGRV